jgi:8-oxo-dGTP pyrophosphatase MutT (NUDIX family)
VSEPIDFSPRAISERLRRRLDPAWHRAPDDPEELPDPRLLERPVPNPRPAAVLVPILAREPEVTVLLTERAASLRDHSGQIAFPGGKLDAGESALQAALREAQEEVGLDPAGVAPLGELDAYFTGTGFQIMPVVAMVVPEVHLTINAREVADTFEVPLSFLLDRRNHLVHSREWQGAARSYYAMPYGERYIWGATAAIIWRLYERLR